VGDEAVDHDDEAVELVDDVVEGVDEVSSRLKKWASGVDKVVERLDEFVEGDEVVTMLSRGVTKLSSLQWPTGRQSGEGKNGLASVTTEWHFKEGVAALTECLRGRMRAVSRTATLHFHLELWRETNKCLPKSYRNRFRYSD
jgi:hypothetical protein